MLPARIALLAGALSALTLSGCAGSKLHDGYLNTVGDVRVELADAADHDFRVYVRNTVDVGWHGDEPADRLRVMRSALAESCAAPELVDEVVLTTGAYLTRPARTYVMRVRCAVRS